MTKKLQLLAAAVPSLAALLASPAAIAGPFVVRTSRPAYADTEVARPVTIAKEWAEFGLTYQYRDVTQFTDNAGKTHPTDYKYAMSWLALSARYGFTKNLTMFMNVPYSVESKRTGGADGETNVMGNGMGDVQFGVVWQAWQHEKGTALSSVAMQFDTKQPTGNESPGVPGNRSLMTGTGTTNAGFHLIGKQRMGPVAVIANAGYTHKFSAVTMWVRDTDGPGGLNGRIKPGNELGAGLHVIGQPIRLAAVDVGADYVSREAAKVGHTANGINPAADLATVPCQNRTVSGGTVESCSNYEGLTASGRLIVDYNTNWDFVVGASVPLMSKNSDFFFPLEDLSTSYGTTVSGSVLFRW